jgi:hypothetical protein
MPRFPIHVMVALLTMSGVAVLASGCSSCEKKPPPVIDPGPPPPAPVDAGLVPLTPLDDSLDAGVDGGPPKPHGSWTPPNPNVARMKQCCAAIRKEAKNLGAAPEATMLVGIAAQCDMMASQLGSSGTAPEFAQVRQLLKGRTIPAACSGM